MPFKRHRGQTGLRLLLSLGLMYTLSAAAQTTDPIRFAPLPLEDRKIIQEQFQGLVDHLGRETGLRFRMVHLNDYADILQRFQRNQVDLVYLGPLPYVILKRDCTAAEPLVCFRDVSGAASYTCSLVTYGEDSRGLADLKGVRIGLTQPYSTCGYLAVSRMLGEAGLALDRDGNSFRYAGSHSKAALAVVRGEFDVAGVKSAIARRYLHMNLRIIADSHPFPGFTLVANRNTLDPDTIARLRQVLLALDPAHDPRHRNLVKGWGRHLRQGAIPPAACDYSGVQEALEHIPWPIPGAQP